MIVNPTFGSRHQFFRIAWGIAILEAVRRGDVRGLRI